jgi:hypothetical protein
MFSGLESSLPRSFIIDVGLGSRELEFGSRESGGKVKLT